MAAVDKRDFDVSKHPSKRVKMESINNNNNNNKNNYRSPRDTLSSTFYKFPHELLIGVFQHLSTPDLISLSEANSMTNQLLKPYLFNELSLNWDWILNKLDGNEYIKSISKYVEKLDITEPNLSNEWNFKFEKLLNIFTNLEELTLNISNSSNFLKYNNMSWTKIKKLKIKTYNTNEPLFSLSHLMHLPNLRELTIDGFMIDFDERDLDDLNFSIRKLNIINCTWNYPFKLSNFGFNSIEVLNLTYSDPFVISERFKEFLHNPNMPNLVELTIKNSNPSIKLHITYRIMNFLKNIPNLKKLYLVGNIYNETINHFTAFDLENIHKARYCLNVNNVKIFYSKFVQ